MTRSPVDANECSSRSERVQATSRRTPERPVSGFVRTRKERTDGPAWHLRRVPKVAAAILGQPVRAIMATTGPNSVAHEVIAAHGTTTAPAAIVTPIRDAGI